MLEICPRNRAETHELKCLAVVFVYFSSPEAEAYAIDKSRFLLVHNDSMSYSIYYAYDFATRTYQR